MKRGCIALLLISLLIVIPSSAGGTDAIIDPNPLVQPVSANYSVPPYPIMSDFPDISDNFSAQSNPDILVASSEDAYVNPYQNQAILVQFDPASDSIPYRTHSPLKSQILRDYSADGLPGLQLVIPPPQISVIEAVSYYQNQPGVLYAEPDYYRFTDRIPSDPDFWRQWGLLNSGQTYKEETPPGDTGADVKATSAWDQITGGESVIAVLDSGVDYLHPDLAENIWSDPDTGIKGYDAITGDLEPMDLASHGTHCAGIIGAVGDNALGIAGVNWKTRIMPVRFLNSFGTGTVSDEIEAILWAKTHGAKIISCSYGAKTYSRAEYEVMKNTDALFICAAGNAGVDTDKTPYYPACLDLPNIITVAASDSKDKIADFSNFGKETVDIGAPGVEIYSTKHNVYQPDPVWTDPFDSLENWTVHGNWTLDTTQGVSLPSSAKGTMNRTNQSDSIPLLLTLASPLSITGYNNPILSYDWSLVGQNYSFSLEGSTDGRFWQPLEYTRGDFMIAPFIRRECKIPVDLRDGHLFIRFVGDGDLCLLGLDDITLSEGYGALNDTRWGYMDGTSMACPQVAGMAGLLAAAAPDASLGDIKKAILTSAHPLPDFAEKSVSGGRADLDAALRQITGGSSYHLRLQSGWNHVSIPSQLISGNDTAGGVFGSLSNVSGHSLYRFDDGGWIAVKSGEQIIPLHSYWVFSGSPASLPLMVDTNQSGYTTRNLSYGWNGFGIKGEEGRPAKTELSSLSDIWTYLIGFNSSAQISDEPIMRGGSGKQNDSRVLEPYQGYWIYLTRNATYEKNETVMPVPLSPEMNQPIWPKPLR